MTRGTIFWFLMLLCLVLWMVGSWGTGDWGRYGLLGNGIVQFILFGLLGWNVFGPAIKG